MSIKFTLALTILLALPVSANADLWVQAVQSQETSVPPPPNGSVVIDFVISNIGDATAYNFYIAGYSNRSSSCSTGLVLEDSAFIKSLDPGFSLSGSFVLHSRPGDVDLYGVVKADTTNVVIENNEANNCKASFIINVLRADLTVQSVTGPDPMRIAAGATETALVTDIKNLGLNNTGWPAGASTVHYFISTAITNPPQADRISIETPTPPLDINNTALHRASISVDATFPLGTYNLFAKADGTNAITELSETNNFSVARTLEVVDICELADVDSSGSVTILDLIALTNNGAVTLVDSSNQHLNLSPSPFPFPEMIQYADFQAALACWGAAQYGPGSGSLLDFNLTPAGSAWQVSAELEGDVSAIDVYVKLPLGFSLEQAWSEDALASNYVDVLNPTSNERILLNQFNQLDLSGSSVSLNGTLTIATLEASDELDLSQLATVTDPAEFKCGIAVNILFAGGSNITLLKRFTYVEIPDPLFRACVDEVLGLDPQDAIPESLAATVTELHMENKGITDLTGIEHFTNLTTLLVTTNQITTLPDLSKLTDLEILDANYNQLIRIGNLPGELTLLFIAHNQLSQLPNLSHITPLWVLNVENNQLQSLPSLTYNTQMEVLSCKENLLTSLPDLPASIKNLVAHDNRLTTLPDMTGISPDYIDLHNNYLTDLTPLTSLTFPAGAWLFLEYNNLDPTDCNVIRPLVGAVDNLYRFPQNTYSSFLCRNQ